jgi:hypothetical protein
MVKLHEMSVEMLVTLLYRNVTGVKDLAHLNDSAPRRGVIQVHGRLTGGAQIRYNHVRVKMERTNESA